VKLEVQDLELIEHAKNTRRTLYCAGRHEVASALRTHSGEVFAGIHIEANVGFADVCGEVAAICHAVAHGHGDLDTIVALGGDGPDHIYPDAALRTVQRSDQRHEFSRMGDRRNA
jgi:cytidine deaminase